MNADQRMALVETMVNEIVSAALARLPREDRMARLADIRRTGWVGADVFPGETDIEIWYGGRLLATVERSAFSDENLCRPLVMSPRPVVPDTIPPEWG